jgi:hypothetical protein
MRLSLRPTRFSIQDGHYLAWSHKADELRKFLPLLLNEIKQWPKVIPAEEQASQKSDNELLTEQDLIAFRSALDALSGWAAAYAGAYGSVDVKGEQEQAAPSRVEVSVTLLAEQVRAYLKVFRLISRGGDGDPLPVFTQSISHAAIICSGSDCTSAVISSGKDR